MSQIVNKLSPAEAHSTCELGDLEMYRFEFFLLIALGSSLFLGACTPNPANETTLPIVTQTDQLPVGSPTVPNYGKPSPKPPQTTPEDLADYPQAVWAAIQDLALRLEISPDQVQVNSFQGEEWPDSCLGLAAFDEMCLQVITPGYRILLSAKGMRYEYHTDQAGDALRVIGDAVLEPIKPGMDVDKSKAILAAMKSLNLITGISINEIQITSTEAIQWPDSCLDLASPDEMCTEVITPGWNIILEAEGKYYEFHTNQSGENIRQK